MSGNADWYFYLSINAKEMSIQQNQWELKPVHLTEPFMEHERKEKVNMVEEPPHYKQGRTEVFYQMLKLFGREAVMNYCEINAFKYRMRAGYKGDIKEDIEKSMWYEARLKELMNEVG